MIHQSHLWVFIPSNQNHDLEHLCSMQHFLQWPRHRNKLRVHEGMNRKKGWHTHTHTHTHRTTIQPQEGSPVLWDTDGAYGNYALWNKSETNTLWSHLYVKSRRTELVKAQQIGGWQSCGWSVTLAKRHKFSVFCFRGFLATPPSLWEVSSPTCNWTQAMARKAWDSNHEAIRELHKFSVLRDVLGMSCTGWWLQLTILYYGFESSETVNLKSSHYKKKQVWLCYSGETSKTSRLSGHQ